MGNMKMPNVQA